MTGLFFYSGSLSTPGQTQALGYTYLISNNYKSMQKEFTVDEIEALEDQGTTLAQQCKWDGEMILAVAYHALVDANFHTEATKLLTLIDELYE